MVNLIHHYSHKLQQLVLLVVVREQRATIRLNLHDRYSSMVWREGESEEQELTEDK